jgi:hypothetical protein
MAPVDPETKELATALLRRVLTPAAAKLKVKIGQAQDKVGANPVAAIGGLGVGLAAFLGNSKLPTQIKLPLQLVAGFASIFAAHNRVSPIAR